MNDLRVEMTPCLQNDGREAWVAVLPGRYTVSVGGLTEAWALVAYDREEAEYIPVPVFTEWFV